MPRFGGRRLRAKQAIDTFRGLPVPNPTDCKLVARIEVKSVALHKYTLLLGQRSRPLAFAGSTVLRSSPQKNRLLPLVVIRRTERVARQLLGRVP